MASHLLRALILPEYSHQENNIQNTTDNKDDRTDDINAGPASLDIAFSGTVLRLFARLGNIIVRHNDTPSLALCMLIIECSGEFMFFKYVTLVYKKMLRHFIDKFLVIIVHFRDLRGTVGIREFEECIMQFELDHRPSFELGFGQSLCCLLSILI